MKVIEREKKNVTLLRITSQVKFIVLFILLLLEFFLNTHGIYTQFISLFHVTYARMLRLQFLKQTQLFDNSHILSHL